MNGRPHFTATHVRFQLSIIEWLMTARSSANINRYYCKWRRHYLLKRLLEIQLKEFNHEV